MNLLIPIAVGALVLAGLIGSWIRFRETRAGFSLSAAFGMGLAPIISVAFFHVVWDPDEMLPETMTFAAHLAMCLVVLLLLGTIVSLGDPPSVVYRKAEMAVGFILAGLAVVSYGLAAWRAPQEQNEVVRIVYLAAPLPGAVAIMARFGFRRDGLIGEGAFLVLFVSNLIYWCDPPPENGRSAVLDLADVLQMVGYVGILKFLLLVSKNAEIHRTPWPGGSLGINLTRICSVACLAICLGGCGYLYFETTLVDWSAQRDSTFAFFATVLSAVAFGGCLVGVAGLTTGSHRPWGA